MAVYARAWRTLQAVKRSPSTDGDAWYHVATDAGGSPPCLAILYGNGMPSEPDVARHVRTACLQEALPIKLRAGDIVRIPYKFVQLGRTPFTDAGRRLEFTLTRGSGAA